MARHDILLGEVAERTAVVEMVDTQPAGAHH
jgi:hypothetical protein